ncbi:UNVERIFIED_CONTAM: hypothetical protein K2H54_017573 [Gekko kuhli]
MILLQKLEIELTWESENNFCSIGKDLNIIRLHVHFNTLDLQIALDKLYSIIVILLPIYQGAVYTGFRRDCNLRNLLVKADVAPLRTRGSSTIKGFHRSRMLQHVFLQEHQ